MPRRLPDGTIISSNTTLGQYQSSHKRLFKNFEIHKAVVVDVIYIDDKRNRYKFGTEYNVLIANGSREGEQLTNVMSLNMFGGINNFCEWVYNKRKVNVRGGKNVIQAPNEEFDNAYVIVGFLSGYYNAGVILGAFPHALNQVEKPTSSDGEIFVWEYNGVRWKVNDLGELTFTYYGGKRDPKAPHTPSRASTGPTQINIDQSGRLTLSDNESQIITFDRVAQTLTLSNPQGFVKLDLAAKTISLDSNDKITTRSTGNQTNTIGGNEINLITGSRGDTVGSGWTINVTGNVDMNSTGNVTIDASGNVELQGNSKNVVTTGSYDPFLMAPHIEGFTKVKAGG